MLHKSPWIYVIHLTQPANKTSYLGWVLLGGPSALYWIPRPIFVCVQKPRYRHMFETNYLALLLSAAEVCDFPQVSRSTRLLPTERGLVEPRDMTIGV